MRTLALLLLLLASQAHAQCLPCERHSPYLRLSERVQVATSERVTNEVTLRNTDTCGCGSSCFQLSSGYHPPHDGSPSLRVLRTRLAGNGACLHPGQEYRTTLTVTLAPDDGEAGYITPTVEAQRPGLPRYEYVNGMLVWGSGYFEEEGGAVCRNLSTAECSAFVYVQGPGK